VTAPGSPPGARLAEFVRRLPKAELHVHLEGAMPPATLLALARRHRIALPADDEAGLERWFRFRDFDHFVEVYLAISACLRDAEDFHRLALDVVAGQARQGVVYTEAHFTAGTHLGNGADGGGLLDALADAAAEGERRFGSALRLIPDVVRNLGPDRADVTLDWAIAARGRRLAVALGLAGIERGWPTAPFAGHFAAAAAAGLHRVAHAGEHAGADSVREAIEHCAPERIGHGVRAVEDPALVAELAARGLPLEVCPTSNLRLGVYPSLAAHPFDRLRRAGVAVTVNSDDPPLFGTTLEDEYLRLAATFGYGPADLAALARASFRDSFLPAPERERRQREVERRAADLGEELFGAAVEPAG
jgi:adenosine deaminase